MKVVKVEAQVLVWLYWEHKFWMAISPVNRPGELLVRVTTDDGLVGLGHTDAGGVFRTDGRGRLRPGPAALALRDGLAPLVVGQDPTDVEQLWDKMFELTYKVGWTEPGWSRTHILTAMAAMDMALWDLKAKAAGQPVWKLLGARRNRVPCYVAGGYYREGKTLAHLARECESLARQAFKAIKIRVGHVPLAEDVERVRAARQAVGPGVKLMLDANESYDVEGAVHAAEAYAPFDIAWFEEPVRWYDGLDGLREVARRISIPIAAGEQANTRWEARHVVEHTGLKFMQYDCMRVAGPTEWLRVAALCQPLGVLMAPHHGPHMHAPLVASVPHGAYVETFPDPFTYPLQDELPYVRWDKKRELFSVHPEIQDGDMLLSDLPGWGIEFDERIIRERAIAF